MGKPIPLGIGRVGKVGWKREVERERPLNHLSPRGLVGLLFFEFFEFLVWKICGYGCVKNVLRLVWGGDKDKNSFFFLLFFIFYLDL